MTTTLADSPEFVESFVKHCFDKGFTEKQAAHLLHIAVVDELAASGDEHFQEGLTQGYVKQAVNPVPYLLKLPRGLTNKTLGTAVAGGAGGAMFGDPEGSTMGNIMTGAGMGAGLHMAAGPMFKGKNFSKFLSGMNPLTKAGPGASKGTIGVNLLKPFETMGKAVTTKGVLPALAKGTAFGALGGGAYSLGAGAGIGGGVGLGLGSVPDSSNFLPSYMQGGGAGNGAAGPPGGRDIFSMPPSLKDYYANTGNGRGYGGGMGAAGVLGFNPISDLKGSRAEQANIDSQLNTLNMEMSKLDPTNPMAAIQRIELNKRMAKLQAARNSSQRDMEKALAAIQSDSSKHRSSSADAEASASKSIARLQKELTGNEADYNAGNSSSMYNMWNKINPMNWTSGGLEERMRRNTERLKQQYLLQQRAQAAQKELNW